MAGSSIQIHDFLWRSGDKKGDCFLMPVSMKSSSAHAQLVDDRCCGCKLLRVDRCISAAESNCVFQQFTPFITCLSFAGAILGRHTRALPSGTGPGADGGISEYAQILGTDFAACCIADQG